MSDFFLYNLAKSYQSIIAWFIDFRGILNFSIRFRQSISTSVLLKYPNFDFAQGSVDLVITVQISKSVVMTMNVPVSILVCH